MDLICFSCCLLISTILPVCFKESFVQCVRVFSVSFIMAILLAVKWHLIVILNFISLIMLSSFMCYCHFCIMFGEMSIHILVNVLFGLYVFLLLNCGSSLQILDTRPLLGTRFANFLPFYMLSFHLLDNILWYISF